MALSEGTPTLIDNNAQLLRARKIDTDKAIITYDDITSGLAHGIIIDISGGSISAGSENAIWDTEQVNTPSIITVDTSKVVMVGEPDDTNDPEARTLTISGNTITENTVEVMETAPTFANQFETAMVSGSIGLAAYWSSSGHRLCRYTISGNTVTAGTPQAHSEPGLPRGMCKLDSSRVFYFFEGGSDLAYIQVINISSGITEGTDEIINETTNRHIDTNHTGVYSCVKLDTDKVFVMWADNTEGEVCGLVVTTSGNNIDSYGTIFNIGSGSVASFGCDFIDSSTVIVVYRDSGGSAKAETLNISGSTITSNADTVTLTRNHSDSFTAGNTAITVLSSTQALYTVVEDITQDLYASIITGFTAAGGGTTYGYQHSGGGMPGTTI